MEVLDYPACPCAAAKEWSGWAEAGDDHATASAQGRGRSARGNSAGPAGIENEAEAARRSFEGGRVQGREEGREAEREVRAAAMASEAEKKKRQLGALVARFAEESERYCAPWRKKS